MLILNSFKLLKMLRESQEVHFFSPLLKAFRNWETLLSAIPRIPLRLRPWSATPTRGPPAGEQPALLGLPA